MKYMLHSSEEGIIGEYNTKQEAVEAYDNEKLFYYSEGVPTGLTFKIYKLEAQSETKVVAERKDYTEEEWEEEGYNSWFDTILKMELKEVSDEGTSKEKSNK